jgi:hypothetical protein
MTEAAASPHVYVSTACFHGECGSCRNTCKYCDAPCSCRTCHPASGQPLPEPWVDQARGIARELLRYGLSTNEAVPPELLDRITSDPALFWLRGEAQPPGVWRPGQHHSEGPAAEAVGSHNAMLDLLWLTEAGWNVELIRRQRSWRVSLSPAPDGWTALCGQGGSIGEALAKARKWAEERAS